MHASKSDLTTGSRRCCNRSTCPFYMGSNHKPPSTPYASAQDGSSTQFLYFGSNFRGQHSATCDNQEFKDCRSETEMPPDDSSKIIQPVISSNSNTVEPGNYGIMLKQIICMSKKLLEHMERQSTTNTMEQPPSVGSQNADSLRGNNQLAENRFPNNQLNDNRLAAAPPGSAQQSANTPSWINAPRYSLTCGVPSTGVSNFPIDLRMLHIEPVHLTIPFTLHFQGTPGQSMTATMVSPSGLVQPTRPAGIPSSNLQHWTGTSEVMEPVCGTDTISPNMQPVLKGSTSIYRTIEVPYEASGSVLSQFPYTLGTQTDNFVSEGKFPPVKVPALGQLTKNVETQIPTIQSQAFVPPQSESCVEDVCAFEIKVPMEALSGAASGLEGKKGVIEVDKAVQTEGRSKLFKPDPTDTGISEEYTEADSYRNNAYIDRVELVDAQDQRELQTLAEIKAQVLIEAQNESQALADIKAEVHAETLRESQALEEIKAEIIAETKAYHEFQLQRESQAFAEIKSQILEEAKAQRESQMRRESQAFAEIKNQILEEAKAQRESQIRRESQALDEVKNQILEEAKAQRESQIRRESQALDEIKTQIQQAKSQRESLAKRESQFLEEIKALRESQDQRQSEALAEMKAQVLAESETEAKGFSAEQVVIPQQQLPSEALEVKSSTGIGSQRVSFLKPTEKFESESRSMVGEDQEICMEELEQQQQTLLKKKQIQRLLEEQELYEKPPPALDLSENRSASSKLPQNMFYPTQYGRCHDLLPSGTNSANSSMTCMGQPLNMEVQQIGIPMYCRCMCSTKKGRLNSSKIKAKKPKSHLDSKNLLRKQSSTRLGEDEFYSAQSDSENEVCCRSLATKKYKCKSRKIPSKQSVASDASEMRPVDMAVLQVLERMMLVLDRLDNVNRQNYGHIQPSSARFLVSSYGDEMTEERTKFPSDPQTLQSVDMVRNMQRRNFTCLNNRISADDEYICDEESYCELPYPRENREEQQFENDENKNANDMPCYLPYLMITFDPQTGLPTCCIHSPGRTPLPCQGVPVISTQHVSQPTIADQNIRGENRVPHGGEMPVDAEIPIRGEMNLEAEMLIDEEIPIYEKIPIDEEMPIVRQMSIEADVPISQQVPLNAKMPVRSPRPSLEQMRSSAQMPSLKKLPSPTRMPGSAQMQSHGHMGITGEIPMDISEECYGDQEMLDNVLMQDEMQIINQTHIKVVTTEEYNDDEECEQGDLMITLCAETQTEECLGPFPASPSSAGRVSTELLDELRAFREELYEGEDSNSCCRFRSESTKSRSGGDIRTECDCCHCRANRNMQGGSPQPICNSVQACRNELKAIVDSIISDLEAMEMVRKQSSSFHLAIEASMSVPRHARKSFPVTIAEVTELGKSSLYVKWVIHDCNGVGGYEIYVDGYLTNRYFNARHEAAVVCEVDVSQPHKIALMARPKVASERAILGAGDVFEEEEPTLLPSHWTPSIYLYEPHGSMDYCKLF